MTEKKKKTLTIGLSRVGFYQSLFGSSNPSMNEGTKKKKKKESNYSFEQNDYDPYNFDGLY